MHSSSLTASTSLPPSAAGLPPSRHAENLIYQAVTVAAMLLLLVSIWVF
jgi:hypothetical protein